VRLEKKKRQSSVVSRQSSVVVVVVKDRGTTKRTMTTRTTMTRTTRTMRDAMVRAFSSGAAYSSSSSHGGNAFLRRMMIGRGAPAASFASLAPVVPCSCDQQTNNDRVWNVSCRAAFASGDERRRKSFYANFRRNNRSQRRSRSSGASPPKTTTTRVSETRVYYPGQTYEPSELEGSFASAAPSASQKTRRVLKKGKDLDALVARSIDWKDAKTLSTRFVSETGKILPRRQTGLGAKTHRLVAKNIKIARIMGVLPFTDRLPQFARRRKNPYS
jgi:small subunit ribosomal protein S18